MTDAPDKLVVERFSWRWAVPGAIIAVLSICLTWAAQGLPTLCPAIRPAPPSCAADARFVSAVFGSIFLTVLFAALLVTGVIFRTGHRDMILRILRIFLIVIVVAAVVVPLWTLTASGFALG